MRIAILATARTFGGIQMLTVRLSEYLKLKGISFFLITTKKTRISKSLAWAEQADLSELGTETFHPTHMLLPHVSGLKAAIPWKNIAGTKLLVWAVHPTEIFTTFFPSSEFLLRNLGFTYSRLGARLSPARRTAITHLFELMHKKNALIAMDMATSRGLRFFYPGITSPPPILPIPCPISHASSIRHKAAKSELSLAYFGRIDHFKYSALKNFIGKDLRLLASKQSVDLHLIAEGPLLTKLLEDCSKAGVHVHNYGFMDNHEARRLVRERTHLAVAMGTAALDIAATGHPCLILDPAHHNGARAQERFRFVSEIDGYTLGEYRDFPGYQPGLHTFDEALTILRTNDTLGTDCANYVRENHDPENVFGELIKLLAASTLLAADVSAYSDKLNA